MGPSPSELVVHKEKEPLPCGPCVPVPILDKKKLTKLHGQTMHIFRISFICHLLCGTSTWAFALSPPPPAMVKRRQRLSHNVNPASALPIFGGAEPILRSSRLYGTNSKEGERTYQISDKVVGILVLMTVPMAWGTYTPVVRYLYAIQPAVPGFVFSACYYTVAAITTSSLVYLHSQKLNADENPQDPSTNGNSSLPMMGGLELGSYLFIANCLQVVGLETVESDRAGFLVQFTTILVPFFEALLAGNLLAVPVRTWFACVLAFLGLFVMGLDEKADMASDPLSALVVAVSSFNKGDFLILGAAVLYTLHVVRLGSYAKETTPMKLAAAKASVETLFSILLVLGLSGLTPLAGQESGLLGFGAETGKEITSFFSSFSYGLANDTIPRTALLSAFGAILWTGWVTCAYTIYAQSFGQSRVSPTNANLIYTFQPIFTAFFAWSLLGETMGPAGVVGGIIIASAVYVVASANLAEAASNSALSIENENFDLGAYHDDVVQANLNQAQDETIKAIGDDEKPSLLFSETMDRGSDV